MTSSEIVSSNDALRSIFDAQEGPDKYPSAKTVLDIHRNSDVDKNERAQHHTLGTGRYAAAPGNHKHDGENSLYLFEGVEFTGSIADPSAISSFLSKIIGTLVTVGAKDSTINTPKGLTWRQIRDGF